MNLPLALMTAGLAGFAVWMLLDRSLVRLVLGVALLGHVANLILFQAGAPVVGNVPLVPQDATLPKPGHNDPVPHALILTAIVIGFGVVAFLTVLVRRIEGPNGGDDIDSLRSAES